MSFLPNANTGSAAGSTATGTGSHAEGDGTNATNTGAHAEGGPGTTASGLYAHAEGEGTLASAEASSAGGYFSTASRLGQYAWSSITSGGSGFYQYGRMVYGCVSVNGATVQMTDQQIGEG